MQSKIMIYNSLKDYCLNLIDTATKFYICNIYFNKYFHNIYSVVSEITSDYNYLQSRKKLEYLKIYLQTNEGKNNINLKDYLGWTPLMIASFRAHTPIAIETMELLIQNGANVNSRCFFGTTVLMKASEYSNIYIPPEDILGYRWSIKAGSIDAVKLLIDNGANINLETIDGWTALMCVCKKSNETSSIETVKLLIESGANINMQNNEGETALMIASKYSNTTSSIETIKLLIESGANVNLQNNKGDTALIIAIKYLDLYSSIETVKLLIENYFIFKTD